MSKWFITGGCGFIGRNLVSMLLARDVAPGDIRIFDNLSVGTVQDLEMVCGAVAHDAPWSGDKVSLIKGDIRDRAALKSASEGANIIVHLAACTGVAPSVEDPFFDNEQNVLGTLNALEAARANGVDRFVFASSGAPLGLVEPPIHERLAANPASPYAASKLAGEGYCLAYSNCFGVPTVILRFGNVFGPYSDKKASAVAKFISRALNGETLEVYGDGSNTRDFIYSVDLCDAIWRGAHTDTENTGEIYQIATNRETSVNELVELLQKVFKKHGIDDVSVVFSEARQGDVPRNFSDITKAKTRLGWNTSGELEELLSKTLEWHMEHHKAKAG